MKHLYIIRHAKAVHLDPRYDDFDRPLTPVGHQMLTILTDQIEKEKFQPEIVLCSPARRTRETLEGIRSLLPTFATTFFDDGLYLASRQRLLSSIYDLDNQMSYALIVGHNPGIEQLVNWVAREEEGDLARPYPTGGFCHLQFKVDTWADIAQASGKVLTFVIPEEPI